MKTVNDLLSYAKNKPDDSSEHRDFYNHISEFAEFYNPELIIASESSIIDKMKYYQTEYLKTMYKIQIEIEKSKTEKL